MALQHKVVEYRNLPARPPVLYTVVAWLSLDHWHAASWIWGAVGVLVVLFWIGYIVGISTEERVDIFKR